jgi:hypothetical protein
MHRACPIYYSEMRNTRCLKFFAFYFSDRVLTGNAIGFGGFAPLGAARQFSPEYLGNKEAGDGGG